MSRCPACHGVMGASSWCPYCCREWSVMVYADPAPEPMQRGYSRPRKSKGMGSRALSDAQRERIKQRLATGKYGVQSAAARDYCVAVSTIARIAAEMRTQGERA